MLEPANLRRADLVSGTLISAVGVGVISASMKMPMGGTYGGVDNPWYASPGAVPLLLGILFFFSGIGVFLKGWKEGGGQGFVSFCRTLCSDRHIRSRVRKVGGLWLGLLGYVVMLAWKPFGHAVNLFGRMFSPSGHLGFLTEVNGANYWIASALFLIGFVWMFRPSSDPKLSWLARGGMVVLLSVAPLVLGYLFSVHLQVPLP
jgi:hypothetical protein